MSTPEAKPKSKAKAKTKTAAAKKTVVRKPNRYMQVTCTHCGEQTVADRSLAVPCPVCETGPGARCLDLRSKAKGNLVYLDSVHPARINEVNSVTVAVDAAAPVQETSAA